MYLFMKDNMMCVVHVDDTVIAELDSRTVEDVNDIGASKDERCHQFQLLVEG